jgi:hypothetical protein
MILLMAGLTVCLARLVKSDQLAIETIRYKKVSCVVCGQFSFESEGQQVTGDHRYQVDIEMQDWFESISYLSSLLGKTQRFLESNTC